jgi:hypothetical protein
MIICTIFGEERVESCVCNKCHIEKAVTEFRLDPRYTTNPRRRKECRDCEKKYSAELNRVHENAPPKPDVCGLCDEVPYKWVLDHDHKTGKPRDWICVKCNNAIALLGDTVAGVRKALVYLERFE